MEISSPSFVYKLLLAYEGTRFGGWQRQPNAPSIQQTIEEKLQIILKQGIAVTGAGRTDAGVHALGQVAHFFYRKEINTAKLRASLNGLLPCDISVKRVELVSPGFHARYSALGKEYHYHIHLHPARDPFKRLYAWHLPRPLDVNALSRAAGHCIGTHDFTSFANEASAGAAAKNPIRTIRRIDLIEEDEGIRLEFEADSFLYKMIRNLVGTFIEVALGKRGQEELPNILMAKDRRRAGPAAPPQGLFLVRVMYPEG